MDPNKKAISHLESLPQDLLGEIVSRVGASSPQDYYSCILTCKELGVSGTDRRVCEKLNLTPLVNKPLLALSYPTLMLNCLANNNPDAHYIRGITEYFLANNITGLQHLSLAADACHKEAVYLYGILLLCRGFTEKGKQYLSQLKWVEDMSMTHNCWRNIKTSLHGIRVSRKRLYTN